MIFSHRLVWFLLVLLNLLSFNYLSAQSGETDAAIALQQIEELKSGTLLVRLRAYEKQFELAEKSGNETQLEKLKEKSNQEQEQIIAGFKSYDFSAVYLYYDKDQERLFDDDFSVLITTDAEQANVKSLENFFILNPYEAELANFGSSVPGMQVFTNDLEKVKPPFPYYVKMASLVSENPFESMFLKWEEQLDHFYSMSTGVSSTFKGEILKKAERRPQRMVKKLKRITRRMARKK